MRMQCRIYFFASLWRVFPSCSHVCGIAAEFSRCGSGRRWPLVGASSEHGCPRNAIYLCC